MWTSRFLLDASKVSDLSTIAPAFATKRPGEGHIAGFVEWSEVMTYRHSQNGTPILTTALRSCAGPIADRQRIPIGPWRAAVFHFALS
jgi:hypothetical protein